MIQPANNLMGKKWQDPVQEFEPSHHETQRNLVGRADSPDGSPVLMPEEVARRWKVSLDTVYRGFAKSQGCSGSSVWSESRRRCFCELSEG